MAPGEGLLALASRVPPAPTHDAIVALPRQDLEVEIPTCFAWGSGRAGKRDSERTRSKSQPAHPGTEGCV